MSGYARKRIAALPGVKFHTSANPALNNALLAFSLATVKNADIVETLKKRHRVWTRTMEINLNAVRIGDAHLQQRGRHRSARCRARGRPRGQYCEGASGGRRGGRLNPEFTCVDVGHSEIGEIGEPSFLPELHDLRVNDASTQVALRTEAHFERELPDPRQIGVQGVLSRLPERRRIDLRVVGAVVRVVEQVEDLGDAGELDATGQDQIPGDARPPCTAAGPQRVARRDLAGRDRSGTVETVEHRDRAASVGEIGIDSGNDERRGARVQTGRAGMAVRIERDRGLEVVARPEQERAGQREVPGQLVDAVQPQRVTLELGGARPLGIRLERIVALELEPGGVVVMKNMSV